MLEYATMLHKIGEHLPKSHDTTAIRLSLILTKLNSGERFRVEELAEEFNVSTRTIQRDMNERFSYLPIQKENGYYFLEEYCLGKLNFEDIKNFATFSGIKNLYPNLTDSFIVDLLNTKINKTYLIKGYEYEELSAKSELFEVLNIAILKYQTISFAYSDKSREVNPYKLVNTNGIWYLSADESNQLKTFTLRKISNFKATKKIFTPNKEFQVKIAKNQATWFSNNEIEVLLEIDNKAKGYFIRRNLLPHQKIIEQTDDKLIVRTVVSYEEEILNIIKYWIPHIKIIEPEFLQEKLYEQLKDYMD